MFRSKLARTAAVAATAAALLATVTPAAHADAPLDAQTQAYAAALSAKLDKFGVAPDVRDRLVAKFLRGETLDADTSAEAVSESTATENGKAVTRYVFADGSVAVATVELPVEATGDVRGRAIAGCRHEVNRDMHTYTGCEVGWDAATWSMGYYADFGYYQFGSWMKNLRSLAVSGTGTFSNTSLSTIVGTCNSSCTSWGRGLASQSLTVAGVGVTRTVGVKVEVNNTTKKGGRSSAW